MTHFSLDDDEVTTAVVDVSAFDAKHESLLIQYVRENGYPQGMDASDLRLRLMDAEMECSPSLPTMMDLKRHISYAILDEIDFQRGYKKELSRRQMADDIRFIRDRVAQGNPIVEFAKRHPFLAGFFAADLYERTLGRDK